MKYLNVNIDHIATLRQARNGREPDPVFAAQIAVLAGADGIVAHLREDRRHINDRDVRLIRELVETKFDLEMAATPEIIKIAIDIKPELVTLVPEKREELTTEGGLDVAGNLKKYIDVSSRMHDNGIKVSLFIEPEIMQIEAALECKADLIEIHTGTYARNFAENNYVDELNRITEAVEFASENFLRVAAGHGLNYFNVKELHYLEDLLDYSIGHSIIARAAYVGLDKAVREMVEILKLSGW